MTYKTILTPIMFEDTAPAVINSALLLAGRFQAHVQAKHIRQRYAYYPPIQYYPMAMDMSVVVNEQQEKAATKFSHTLKAIVTDACDESGAHIVPMSEALHQNGVTVSWEDEEGVLPTDYGRAMRVADLAVVALPDKKSEGFEVSIFENLLMSSSRPVLLAPRDGLKAVPSKVLVAWDGSQPGARAVDAAMPFLEAADEVVLVTVGEVDLGAPDTEAAVSYLERCGIQAKSTVVDWPKKPVAERLLNQAEAHNCDLIVMGGYSHARMYESVFGGVTNYMLKHADRAILMAH